MNRLAPRSNASCCVGVLLLLVQPLSAQAQATAQPVAKPASASSKPATKAMPAPAAKAPPKPAQVALPAASAEQQEAAKLAYVGAYDCDHGQHLRVAHHTHHAAYIDVTHGKAVWTMKPVLSSTGALRLEDVKGRMLMLQVANKSMVMDTVVGQRVLDGCLHETQRNYVRPADAGSLGIGPATSATAPAAAASTPR